MGQTPAVRRLRVAPWIRAGLFLAASTALHCGYRPLQVQAPFGAQRVAIAPFEETPEVGINAALAGQLAAALTAGGTPVVTDAAQADGLLGGTLRVVSQPGTTLRAIQVYNLLGTADACWRDASGEVVWRASVSAHESFLPQGSVGTAQPLATETQRRMALGRLSERLASEIYRAIMVAQAQPAAQTAAP